MAPPGLHYDTATEAEIIAFCSNPPPEAVNALAFGQYCNQVIPLSAEAVVKYGPGVKEEEFTNLRMAYQLVDPDIVRIPHPYRFFQTDEIGYLVMEYVKGTIIEQTTPSHIAKIGKALRHFSSFRSRTPGPLCGGVSRGLLWGEGNVTEYSLRGSVQKLEHWFNRRLLEGERVSFRECGLVLCHLDIAPRNILWLEGGIIPCFVDWASAGFYPRVFEWCLLSILCGKNGEFQELVRQTMEPLTEWELRTRWLIIKAWGNSAHYYFPPSPL